MRRRRFSGAQIIGTLKVADAGGKVADVCRRHGISQATVHRWNAKHGGMDVGETQWLEALENEPRHLPLPLVQEMPNLDMLPGMTDSELGAFRPSGRAGLVPLSGAAASHTDSPAQAALCGAA